jgi:small subunit ribosomal protein S1
VQGTITKLAKFGAFARLVDHPEIEGLIHISELAQNRVGHPKEVVKEGDVVTLRVIKIDAAQRRLGLSLKKVTASEYSASDYQRAIEPDFADFEAASLKEDDRRRAERKRGGKRSGKRGGRSADFEDDDEY